MPHTRIFDLPPALAESFDADSDDADRLVAMLGETSPLEADLAMVVTPAPQSLSLNVSSSCNLSCGYCYADRGGFGGAQAQAMTFDVAKAAVERLVAGADPARPITIGFLGGEPLRNRGLVHAVSSPCRAAWRNNAISTCAIRSRPMARWSRTPTIELFRSHRFAVTVSVDGDAVAHDAQRLAAATAAAVLRNWQGACSRC